MIFGFWRIEDDDDDGEYVVEIVHVLIILYWKIDTNDLIGGIMADVGNNVKVIRLN